jgi:PAS domain S-box-containing protein
MSRNKTYISATPAAPEKAKITDQQACREWAEAFDAVSSLIFLHDDEFRIIRANRAYAARAGMPLEDIIGKFYWEVFPRSSGPLACCLKALHKEVATEEEIQIATGETFLSRAFPLNQTGSDRYFSVHVMEDISARKQYDAALRASESRFRALAEISPDGIFRTDADGDCLYVNARWSACTGLSPQQAIGRGWVEALHPDDRERVFEEWRYATIYNQSFKSEFRFQKPDGSVTWVLGQAAAEKNNGGEIKGYVGSFTDITEHKQLELLIKNQRDTAQQYLDVAGAIMLVVDRHEKVTLVNRKGSEILAYAEHEILGKSWFDNFVPATHREQLREAFAQMLGGYSESADYVENPVLSRNGEERIIAWHHVLIRDHSGQPTAVLSSGEDVSARMRAESALSRATRALRTLSAGNMELVHAKDEMSLLKAMCRAAVDVGGYRMAWVGFAENDEHRSILPMAFHGIESGYLEKLQFTWSESSRGFSPAGRAIRLGKTQVVQDILTDPSLMACREEAVRRGFRANIALPLSDGHNVFGALSIYAAEADAFPADEIRLLEEMAGDLAFGIATLHTRAERDQAIKEREHHLIKLKESLDSAIQAIAATLEMRDPYTAGHQRRVADLAVAIARKMGLGDEQIYGLHLAGIVHDLGKICIPAEILSRPGELKEVEYMLIKSHPQAGYDILKSIQFPWPIADTVLQHHERHDGSGYPNGLSGSQIIIEARILLVADVVEAMASHRPYRPGRGIADALAEIENNSGVLYDPQVVDACLSLFREESYVLN